MNRKKWKNFTPALILSLSLSNCTSNSGPAQIENNQNIVFTRQGPMEIIRVYPHDTVESIAQQRNVPVEILAATNNLIYPYHLYNVRTLMIPQDHYYRVNSNNETLKSISKKYRVDLMQLMDINNMTHISSNERLRIGTTLRIPTQNSNIKQHIDDQSLKPVYAPTHEYDVMELDEVNAGTGPQTQFDVEESHNDQPKNYSEQPIIEESPDLAFEKELQATLGKPEDSYSTKDSTTDDSKISGFKTNTPLNSHLFIWPLTGTVSRDNKDGITIFAPLNTSVRAAGSGKVIFAENDNGEYGNLVIIKHSDGYLSAYAHNNQILVKKGDEVNKGQTISKVGKSGKVSKPQLFFSMRKGKDIIDPEQDLG
jgi:murein DD-endopeptidase MepM/ murein hydrolase activator NlpD